MRYYLLALAPIVSALAADSLPSDFFEKKIRPVLVTSCYGCHNSKMKVPMGGLVLDTKAGLKNGGAEGPIVVPGKPQDSRLQIALRYTDSHLKMPPAGKLSDAVIADFEAWIAGGAPDPREEAAGVASPLRRVVSPAELEKGRRWWSFQPVTELAAPAVKQTSWPRNKLDSFVLARLEAAKLPPSPEADAATQIRRVSLDLVGLKPSYQDVQSYVNDKSPDRYERLVDRLLASRHYGERWGRYWLDVARYAEDNVGNITNPPFPHAWRYRDWVIDAFNKDVPYDRFVKLQLAADHIADATRQDMAALGFVGLGPVEHKDGRLSDQVIGGLALNDLDERVDTMSRGLLGLSVACARCHDHKFDPIPTRDYYKIESVFASTQRATKPAFDMDPKDEARFMWLYQRLFDLKYTANLLDNEPGSKPEQAARQVIKFRKEIAGHEAEMAELAKRYPPIGPYMASIRYPGQKNPTGKRAAPGERMTVDAKAPFLNAVYDAGMWIDTSEPDVTLFDYRLGEPRDLPVYRGGNYATPGDQVARGYLSVLSKTDAPFRNGSGRLELADRIFSESAPLAARVIVNRVWAWHFGNGIVGTPSDFGSQGDKPTHPELLDDLTARFVKNGWSLKWLHREILLSATYRQSSHPRKDTEEIDPTNRLLWRMNPRRLDIEAYRDSLLVASGALDLTASGPSPDLDSTSRRTVYAKVSRNRLADLLRLYDLSEPMLHLPQRVLTISPTQQLFVLNSPFMREQAGRLAKSVEVAPDAAGRIRMLYRAVLSRDPSPQEVDAGLTYLNGATLPQYAQALLALNEVIFWQ